ncbi:MAG TPA: hypothetical protein VMY36_02330 [Patescibacteria group bacterium]|nr:hypothetical protein [Patescibacteria group bacterium]
MPERPELRPVHIALIEVVAEKSRGEYSLTMDELHELFKRQAEIDDSEDHPVLLSNFVAEVTQDGLYLLTPYTVSDLDNPKERVGLVIEGRVKNDSQGVLSSEESVVIHTDKDTRIRVLEAFGQESDGTLPVAIYLKSMIESALEYRVVIDEMCLYGDRLSVTMSQSASWTRK